MNTLKQKIQKWPRFVEFIIVLSVAFGYFILRSMSWVLELMDTDITVIFSDIDLYNLILIEITALGIIAIFLYLRGWKLSDFHFAFNLDNSTYGLILFSVNYILYYFLYMTVATLFSGIFGDAVTISASPIESSATLPAILAVSIVNPIFEETIVVGYIVKALEKSAIPAVIIGVSVLVRMSYHIYQGPIILVSILPMGILFAYIYWRWRKLWTLILAHAVLDFTSFYFYYVIA